jgi:hypothetical protein
MPAASSLRENADPIVPTPMTAIFSAMHVASVTFKQLAKLCHPPAIAPAVEA